MSTAKRLVDIVRQWSGAYATVLKGWNTLEKEIAEELGEDRRNLMGHIVIEGRHWTTPIVHGGEGSAYLYTVFLWNFQGCGDTPVDALMELREEMMSVAAEDRDTPGDEIETDKMVWVEEE